MRVKFILFLLIFAANASAGDACSQSLRHILERYVEARGGAAALESQQALRLVSTNHEGQWNPKFDYRVMKPGYMWIEAVYDDGATIYEGFDGERGWEKWGDRPAEYVSGDAAKGLNQGAMSPVHLYGLHHMASLGATVESRGCAQLDDETFHVINIVSKFGTDIDYFLNADSYVLERSRTVRPLHPTVDPTPITIEERWADFRWVDGVLHPFGYSLINTVTGEKLSWLEVHTIERVPDLTASFFQKPD